MIYHPPNYSNKKLNHNQFDQFNQRTIIKPNKRDKILGQIEVDN